MASGYKLDYPYRGTALIIGNQFLNDERPRNGCLRDLEMMTDLFRKLDFNVTAFKNLTANQMKEKLKEASRNEKNIQSDCFVCVISSHGKEVLEEYTGAIRSSDIWRHAVLGDDHGEVFVDEIINMFTDDKTVGLAGKPKLFFIQACRSRLADSSYSPSTGDKYDQGDTVWVHTSTNGVKERGVHPTDDRDSEAWVHAEDLTGTIDLYDDWERDPCEWNPEVTDAAAGPQSNQDASRGYSEIDIHTSADTGMLPQSPFDVVPIVCPDDFLVMYPVTSGKFAFRNGTFGSYLLQFLYKGENLTKLLNGCDLLQYLTNVCRNIANYEYKPDLEKQAARYRQLEEQAKREGTQYDRLKVFKAMLHGNMKYLSEKEREALLIRNIINEEHRSMVTGDPSTVEPNLQSLVGRLSEKEMLSILNEILPFKMTACVVHKLKGSVVFQPKETQRGVTPMKKFKVKFLINVEGTPV